MEKQIYTRDEFVRIIEISESELLSWENARLLSPLGAADGGVPVYSDNEIERVTHIKKFLDLGYELPEIRKIIRKVGLPKSMQAKKGPGGDQFLTVGNLADSAGVSPRTIKHWEEKGIIEPEMRSDGGFRLYPKIYVYFCHLIRDLQLFGYTLEEVKTISDYFREFRRLRGDLTERSKAEVGEKVDAMLEEIEILKEKMALLKKGIQRWEDLVRKNKREIINLKISNQKRSEYEKDSINE